METVEDKKLSRIRTTCSDRLDIWCYRNEIERFANRCLAKFGAGKGSPPMKMTKMGLMPIEGGSYPFWEIPENAVKYLEKTSTAILQACQKVVATDKQRLFSPLVNEVIAKSRDTGQCRWDSHFPVCWEYLAELNFFMLSVKKARMRSHLGFFEAISKDNLSLADASQNTLTSDRVREILEKAVPLASTLPELSNLILGFDRGIQADLSTEEAESIITKITTSANQLRPEIERLIGTEQATDFIDELRSMLEFKKHFFQAPRRFGTEEFINNLHSTLGIPRGESLVRKLDQWQEKQPINIIAEEFSKGKTFKLLEKIVQDNERNGVLCEHRTLRTLRENLKEHGKDSNKAEYLKAAKSLKWKKDRARTTIPVGLITIIPKKKKK
ncbi:hypothetical protein ACFL1G_08855 [Planctomycetota bacterium]